MKFTEKITPFRWNDFEKGKSSVCLNVGEYKNHIFLTREDEGFEGSGYDWASLAKVFLSERLPELQYSIKFDPEGSMFCAYSDKYEDLQKFILTFKNICENDEVIIDILSRAELD